MQHLDEVVRDRARAHDAPAEGSTGDGGEGHYLTVFVVVHARRVECYGSCAVFAAFVCSLYYAVSNREQCNGSFASVLWTCKTVMMRSLP